MQKILKNKIRCNYCGDVIESKYTHDFQQCKCGKVFVDGGKDYLRRGYPSDATPEEAYEDLSECEGL